MTKIKSLHEEDIDAGIHPCLERIWEAGYVTEFSCSGLRRDHEQLTSVEFMILKNPFIIFVNSSSSEAATIYRAARISFGAAYAERWFETQRVHVFWKFSSWWFLNLPGRLQDLTYAMCLRIFTWVLTTGCLKAVR